MSGDACCQTQGAAQYLGNIPACASLLMPMLGMWVLCFVKAAFISIEVLQWEFSLAGAGHEVLLCVEQLRWLQHETLSEADCSTA